MHPNETSENLGSFSDRQSVATEPALFSNREAAPQPCPSCGADNGGIATAALPTYVYSVGRIEPRFPRVSVEKELAQIIARDDATGLPDRRVLKSVLSKPENRYLARQMCWIMSIAGLETYLLFPRDPNDLHLLVQSLRPTASPTELDVIIGVKGPIAPAEACNGLMIPVVVLDQIYSFDRESLIKSIPKPEKAENDFEQAAEELFDRIMQITDNAGATDEHRALNYLAMRYHGIYARAAEAFAANCSLSAVDTRRSVLSSTRKIVEVIFSFTNRKTDVTEKSFVRVDVTEEFPFLVSKMTAYYDR